MQMGEKNGSKASEAMECNYNFVTLKSPTLPDLETCCLDMIMWDHVVPDVYRCIQPQTAAPHISEDWKRVTMLDSPFALLAIMIQHLSMTDAHGLRTTIANTD